MDNDDRYADSLDTISATTKEESSGLAHNSEAKESHDIRRHSLPPIAPANVDYHSEAKRITYAYSEEVEKHDLLMKIQETRQRQQLQRKLWQRHQHKQTNLSSFQDIQRQHMLDQGISNDDDEDGDASGGNVGISIGQFKSKIPSMRGNMQPVVRGISMDKIPQIGDQRRQASMMAARGLNLTPMQRK